MTSNTFDYVIAGNGAIGSFLAAELTARGHTSIAVCGDEQLLGGGSQAAGAMLGCFAELTAETLRAESGREKFEFGLAARDRWPKRLAEFREVAAAHNIPMHAVEDTYVVLNTRGGILDSENFDAIIDGARSYGELCEEVAPERITGLRPRPDSRALRAVHLPAEGAVDSHAVLRVLEYQNKAAGVRQFATVQAVEVRDGRAVGVRLTDGTLVEGGAVIVATGARGASLVEPVLAAGELLPTFAGLGFATVTQRNHGVGFTSVVRTPNRAFACGLHLVPLGEGREYVGATNMVVGEARTHPIVGDVHFLLDCAMRQLDEDIYHHDVTEFRVGNRPVTIDGLPLVGWTSCAGLYLVTGTYRDGFHNAPLLAEHIASQLAGEEGVLGDRYAPGRSAVFSRTVDQSISDFVKHRMAAWFEAGAQSPPSMSALELERMLHNQAALFYERFDVSVGLPPDILMHVIATLRSPRTATVLQHIKTTTDV